MILMDFERLSVLGIPCLFVLGIFLCRRPGGLDTIHDETVGSTDHHRNSSPSQVIQLVMAAVQTAAGDSWHPSGM